MREYIGDTLLHLGWAILGSECTCNSGVHFNALAHVIGQWEYNENGLRDRVLFAIGDFLIILATGINEPTYRDVS